MLRPDVRTTDDNLRPAVHSANQNLPMWPLFRPFPPLEAIGLSTRDVVATGALIQRELVSVDKFCSLARDRNLTGISREVLEDWDRQGIFQPLAVSKGGWTNWHEAAPYPLTGIVFRDEGEFRPWSAYIKESESEVQPTILYSEWQLLYLPMAGAARAIQVPIETLLRDASTVSEWAERHLPFTQSQRDIATALHAGWLPTVLALLRLQARHWPFVHGRSVLVYDAGMEQVDALDLELEATSAADLLRELGIQLSDVEESYRWLGERAQSADPVDDLFDLLRLLPRRRLERSKGIRRTALDLYDAAEIFRRFYRETSDQLLPDVDQHGEDEPRKFGRVPVQLVTALRRHRLYPHSLHAVVEGQTEVAVITHLFEAFTGRTIDEAGIAITNLKGDRLEQSRAMLEDFGTYADSVALLLDNENDVERVTQRMSVSERIADLHVTLCNPNLEEENFTSDEFLAIAISVAIGRGESLDLSAEQFRLAIKKRNENAPRQGMASILVNMARSDKHGGVLFKKPELGLAMANKIIEEIQESGGAHQVVAAQRPIVKWVLAFPVRAHQNR